MAKETVGIFEANYEEFESAWEICVKELGLNSLGERLKGKKVLIKPNMLGIFSPQKGATTNPAVLRTLVRWFKKIGAEVMVGDNCGIGGYGANEKSAKKTGLFDASEGSYVNFAKDTVEKKVSSRFFDRLVISKAFFDADYIVNVPKLKTHALTVITCGIKNMFGMVAGAEKSRVHFLARARDEFGEALVDIFQIRPPDLTVLDGIVAMEGNGPSQGRIRLLNKLIVSRNAVAVDSVVARLISVEPKEIYHLWKAGERGLGPLRMEEIEIIGKLTPIARFRLPSTIVKLDFLVKMVNRLFYKRILETKLILNKEKCTGCDICVKTCPSSAMRKGNEYPEIMEEQCIKCFCCFELCPESAWELKGLLKRISGMRV